MAHPDLGKKILDRVADQVAHTARVEVVPKLDGRNMVMVLAPDKRAQAAHAAAQKKEAEDHPDSDGLGTALTNGTEPVPSEGLSSES